MSTAPVFDRLAHRYDSWYERNRVIAELEVRVVASILPKGFGVEVGVGSGYFASKLGVPLGVDPSIHMLRIALARGIEAVQGVGEALPIRTASLDYILIIVTLCFVDNPLQVLKEAARTLKPGGSLITCIVPADSPWGKHYIEMGRKGHPFYSIARFYTVDQVEEMARKAGLKPIETVGILSTPPGKPPNPKEKPTRGARNLGFICIKAIKT